MRWPWRRKPRTTPLEGEGRIAYVLVRPEQTDRWLVCFCRDRDEAMAVTNRYYELGAITFAGEATSILYAHRQLREALHVYRGGGIGPLPWTGYPNSHSGNGSGNGTGLNTVLLRESFERAVNNDSDLVGHFYEELFFRRPELRRYFPQDMRGQVRSLGEKLVEIMLHLEDPEYLASRLPALGAKHHDHYHARPEMFPVVGEVLIYTLREAVGGWGSQTQELTEAWTAAYNTVVALMLRGFPQEAPT